MQVVGTQKRQIEPNSQALELLKRVHVEQVVREQKKMAIEQSRNSEKVNETMTES